MGSKIIDWWRRMRSRKRVDDWGRGGGRLKEKTVLVGYGPGVDVSEQVHMSGLRIFLRQHHRSRVRILRGFGFCFLELYRHNFDDTILYIFRIHYQCFILDLFSLLSIKHFDQLKYIFLEW